MNKVAIIEARMGSTRLPGKHLLTILGKPVIELLIERLKQVKSLDEIVLACTTNDKDDVLEKLAEKLSIKCFRGSEEDVLIRVLQAAKSVKADLIAETLGDCPLTDPNIIEKCINTFLKGNYDYLSNARVPSFPDGFDVQVYPTLVLNEVETLTNNLYDRENVTPFIYNHPEKYKIKNLKAEGELFWPELSITLDTREDFELIKTIFENLYPLNPNFSAFDIVRFIRKNPRLLALNSHITRTSYNRSL